MSSAATFIEDIVHHHQAFAKSKGVNTEEVHIRFSLADGSTFFVRGLKASAPHSTPGWGMIEGTGTEPGTALVIREAHVLKAEFEMTPTQRPPIGLHTEIGQSGGSLR